MWLTMAMVAGVALCIGIYLAIGSVRAGATWREILPPVALLVFGIALAGVLLILEGEVIPGVKYESAGVTYYISMGLPSIVSIAVCLGIAKVWGEMFGSSSKKKADSE
jgi:hypothetical protein